VAPADHALCLDVHDTVSGALVTSSRLTLHEGVLLERATDDSPRSVALCTALATLAPGGAWPAAARVRLLALRAADGAVAQVLLCDTRRRSAARTTLDARATTTNGCRTRCSHVQAGHGAAADVARAIVERPAVHAPGGGAAWCDALTVHAAPTLAAHRAAQLQAAAAHGGAAAAAAARFPWPTSASRRQFQCICGSGRGAALPGAAARLAATAVVQRGVRAAARQPGWRRRQRPGCTRWSCAQRGVHAASVGVPRPPLHLDVFAALAAAVLLRCCCSSARDDGACSCCVLVEAAMPALLRRLFSVARSLSRSSLAASARA
jgi:hypothetical protein